MSRMRDKKDPGFADSCEECLCFKEGGCTLLEVIISNPKKKPCGCK